MREAAADGPFDAVERPELLDLPDQLIGPRMLLRAYRAGDAEAVFNGISTHREDLLQWMGWPSDHQSVADSVSYVTRMAARFALREVLVFGIWDRATHFYLGGAGFHAPQWQVPRAELGYFLLPPARGRGMATEAVRLLIDFGFRHARLNRLWGDCDADNAASAAVMRRAGMTLEATMRHDARDHRGKLRSSLRFALAHDDYPVWRAAHALPLEP